METVTSTTTNKLATWTFTGLDPDAWYEVSVTWPQGNNRTSDASFAVKQGNVALGSARFNQQIAPNDFSDSGVSWERLGTYYVRGGSLSVELTNYLYLNGRNVAADAVRIQKVAGHFGTDDNFLPQLDSLTIDAGDPASHFLAEPIPNGGRNDQGYTGNTALALTSPSQLVQVLSPNGLEKLEVGQPTTITWRSAGLNLEQPVSLLNVGGGALGGWQANDYQVVSYLTASFTQAVDVSGVVHAAPEQVYQSYAYNNGAGNRLAWHLPASDGNYTLRLHFVEPAFTSSGQRKFDVKLQGANVTTNYDIYAAAGARFKATTLSYSVTASGGMGIDLELFNTGYYPAIISGIELFALNPSGTASPTMDVELSIDNGRTWSALATSVAVDRFGNGR